MIPPSAPSPAPHRFAAALDAPIDHTTPAPPVAPALRPAVFLDRDGTINVDAHYLRRIEDVRLIPGAAQAIARLNAAGIPVIVVSNQSGLGRGLITPEEYEAVRQRLEALLAEAGARLDATYICPHAPPGARVSRPAPAAPPAALQATAPSLEPGVFADPPCECRKPGTGLYRRAAVEHGIDLPRSWSIGDRWRDVAPGLSLGGCGILVPSPHTPPDEVARARAEAMIAPTLGDAISRVLDALAGSGQ
jgi:D-glycero-D-manno-heptose 1,7-bisphosphate phosphatase